MGKIKLTNRAVEVLANTNRDTFWWDTDLAGFGVKVTGAGSKIFLLQYRMGGRGAPTRRFTIGKLGSWDAKGAREEAERLLRLVAMGSDPQEAEKERKVEHVELAFSKYAERFLAGHGQREWRARTFETRASDVRRWIIPVLKNKPLPQITRRDISTVLDALPTEFPSLPRNVFAVLRKLFAWAIERGDLERSPCEGIKRPKAVPSRDRVLDDEELMLVAAFCHDLGAPFGPFVRMLLVTGQRRDEVAGICWEEVNRKRREWTLPAARSKNHRQHIMPLSDIALKGLDEMAGASSWPKKGLIFTTNGSTPISGFSRMKSRLDAAMTSVAAHRSLAPWRLHDLRRTMATNLQRLGVRFEVTEALLNHVGAARSGVAGVYQHHDWTSEKREAMNLWDQRLGQMIDEFVEQMRAAA